MLKEKNKNESLRSLGREREGWIPLCSYLTLGATCQLNEEKGTEDTSLSAEKLEAQNGFARVSTRRRFDA